MGSEIDRFLRPPQISLFVSSGMTKISWSGGGMRHRTFLTFRRLQDNSFLPRHIMRVLNVFSPAPEKMHDDLKKNTSEETLEFQLIVDLNLPDT